MFKTNKITYFDCYTLDEVGNLVGRSEKTIRTFIKEGLKTIDNKRPFLIRGYDLVAFLKQKNLKNRHSTNTDEMFCMKCREARTPKSKQICIQSHECASFLCASALCPVCGTLMNKPYSIARFGELKRIFHIVEKLSIHDSYVSPVNYRTDNNQKRQTLGNQEKQQLCMEI